LAQLSFDNLGLHKSVLTKELTDLTMGVPERSAEWESPTLDTGPMTSRLGYSLKMLGPEVPVVVLCFDLLTSCIPGNGGHSSGTSKKQEDGWAYPSERLVACSNSPVFGAEFGALAG
jgi:hypothetical protein